MSRGRPSKKKTILDVAQTLFSLHGYQGTSIDLVVREASVSKPTVYNNFPSKQVLFQELVKRQYDILVARQLLISAGKRPLSEKLYLAFRQVIEQPFEVIIFRVYFGEPHKLNDKSLALCEQFEGQITRFFHSELSSLNLSIAKQHVVRAVYNNALLINTLHSGEESAQPLSYEQLKEQIEVLSIQGL